MKESLPEAAESALAELSRELIRRFDEDQAMRLSGNWDADVDEKNTARMKEIVAAHGWPIVSRFGEQTAHAAWLLVQHADADPQFQAECLALMKKLPEGEVSKGDMAYLEDRVRVNTGRPTLYGTQFYTDTQGRFGPRPIEDPERLEERRAAAGLDSFENYEKDMQRINKERKERG